MIVFILLFLKRSNRWFDWASIVIVNYDLHLMHILKHFMCLSCISDMNKLCHRMLLKLPSALDLLQRKLHELQTHAVVRRTKANPATHFSKKLTLQPVDFISWDRQWNWPSCQKLRLVFRHKGKTLTDSLGTTEICL